MAGKNIRTNTGIQGRSARFNAIRQHSLVHFVAPFRTTYPHNADLGGNLTLPMAPQFRILLLLPLFASLTIQAQDVRVVTRVVSDTVPAWKTWKADGFSMNHPGKWTVDVTVMGDTVVVFRKGIKGADPTTPEVAVIVQGMDGKFAPLPKRLKKSDLKDVEFIQNESSEMASSSRAEYRCKDKGANIHVLEQLVEKGDRSYLLTYMAPAEAYDEYLFLAEAMLNSFSAP